MSREQDCFETGRAAFVMPHWMADDDMALRRFDEAVVSVLEQTDPNWMWSSWTITPGAKCRWPI